MESDGLTLLQWRDVLRENGVKVSPSPTGEDTTPVVTPESYVTSEGSEKGGKGGRLEMLPLVVLVFYGVSGGPFGIEAAVGAGGSFNAILAFIFIPLIWAIPEALVTAELSTAFPEPAGFVAWVETAFGPFWGFMEGYLSWVSGVTDNSLYPLLLYEYVVTVYPEMDHPSVKFPCVVSMVVCLVYLNHKGLEVVGRTATVLCLFSLSPFVVMTVLGLLKMDFSRLGEGAPRGEPDWTLFVNIMFWNFNYWDSAAAFAGEVQDPGRAFPKALCYAVAFVVLAYTIPTVVCIAATRDDLSQWTDGHFSSVGEEIGGKWLGVWVVAGAAVSNIGMFLAELSSDSYQILGMSERGMLPKIFSTRSDRHGSPTAAIMLSCVGIIFLVSFDFHSIIEMLNLLYCFAEVLEFAAFIKLRLTHATLHRPFRVPLSTPGCVIMLLIPTMFIFLLMSLASRRSWYICVGMALLGVVLYHALRAAKRHTSIAFHFPHPLTPVSVATERTPLLTPYHPSSFPEHDLVTGKRLRSPDLRSLNPGFFSRHEFTA